MLIYCLACDYDFESDVMTACPCCGAVGDDLMKAEEDEEQERDPEQDVYDDWVDSQVNAMLEARYGL